MRRLNFYPGTKHKYLFEMTDPNFHSCTALKVKLIHKQTQKAIIAKTLMAKTQKKHQPKMRKTFTLKWNVIVAQTIQQK